MLMVKIVRGLAKGVFFINGTTVFMVAGNWRSWWLFGVIITVVLILGVVVSTSVTVLASLPEAQFVVVTVAEAAAAATIREKKKKFRIPCSLSPED